MRCRQRVTGNLGSEPPNPLFLLDESLVPAVANALELVGYRFTSVRAVFAEDSVKDPDVIDWCRAQEAVWVHADDRARKHHKALIVQSGIRTVLVYRKRGRMTGKEQLRVLSFVLPHLLQEWETHPTVRHYRVAAANSLAKPGVRKLSL